MYDTEDIVQEQYGQIDDLDAEINRLNMVIWKLKGVESEAIALACENDRLRHEITQTVMMHDR